MHHNSTTSGYRDMGITPCIISCDNILGGSRLKNRGNPLKPNFQEVLDHLPGFENYPFFNIQKNFFSLQPSGYGNFGFYDHSDIMTKMAWSQGGHTKRHLLYKAIISEE